MIILFLYNNLHNMWKNISTFSFSVLTLFFGQQEGYVKKSLVRKICHQKLPKVLI